MLQILCTDKCVQSASNTLATMSFPGALDGFKAITYAALIEDYSEANVCLEAALNEARENQGVVGAATMADVELAKEAVQIRLISPEMVKITLLSRQVNKAREELRIQQQLDRRGGSTAASAFSHGGRVHDTHAFEYFWIIQDEQWATSEKTLTN